MDGTLLLRLYPRQWRRRYQDEFLELLAQTPLTGAIILDTLRGALDAHLHPSLIPAARKGGGSAIRYWLLVFAIGLALNRPRTASGGVKPRYALGSAFSA